MHMSVPHYFSPNEQRKGRKEKRKGGKDLPRVPRVGCSFRYQLNLVFCFCFVFFVLVVDYVDYYYFFFGKHM